MLANYANPRRVGQAAGSDVAATRPHLSGNSALRDPLQARRDERNVTPRMPALVARCSLVCFAALTSACASLASSPGWVGGTMATGGPLRAETNEDHERAMAAGQPKEIGARHILVMHSQSVSKPSGVVRTKAEARARAQEVLIRIRQGAPFEQMVNEFSDEPGAADRGGDLGIFDRRTMVKAFSDAAFALKVGEVSELVETPFGYHIIKRTE